MPDQSDSPQARGQALDRIDRTVESGRFAGEAAVRCGGDVHLTSAGVAAPLGGEQSFAAAGMNGSYAKDSDCCAAKHPLHALSGCV